MVLLRNENNLRSAEDEMTKYLNRKGITSYSYLD
ncbi:hypothetical protein J2772_000056 [Chryseobacterium jejuense]|nr:hypothetical protein [Chryseobacterium jejuense]